MAAQDVNYLLVDANFRGSNNVLMVINPARASQFGSGITNLSSLLSFIKATFYLDDVIGFTGKHPSTGVQGNGFWGTCIVGGFNESMHKSSRIVEVHGDTLSQVKRTFNDAGLNTKGLSVINSVTSARVSEILINVTYKSAYFVFSDEIGIYSNLNGGIFDPVTDKSIEGNQAQNTTQTIDVSPVVYPDMKAGDILNVKSYIKNIEGETLSQLLSITLKPALFRARGPEAYASYAILSTQIVQNLYSNTAEFAPGSIVWRNDNMTQYAPAGYYSTEDRSGWYQIGTDDQGRSVVLRSGAAGVYDPSDPGYIAPFVEIVFIANHPSIFANACAIANSSPTSRIVYQTNPYTDGRYYADIFLTTPLFDNYFVMDEDGVHIWLKLVNGYEVERGNC